MTGRPDAGTDGVSEVTDGDGELADDEMADGEMTDGVDGATVGDEIPGDAGATVAGTERCVVDHRDGDRVAAVRRALRALIDGSAPSRRPPSAVVREGEASLADVRRAARFVERGGLDRLRRAVDVAADGGKSALAADGRAVVAAVERYRTAAAGTKPPAPADGEHFHFGRATPIGGDEQRTAE